MKACLCFAVLFLGACARPPAKPESNPEASVGGPQNCVGIGGAQSLCGSLPAWMGGSGVLDSRSGSAAATWVQVNPLVESKNKSIMPSRRLDCELPKGIEPNTVYCDDG